jgi:hypothetical protein
MKSPTPFQFSLSSLFLITTLVALIMGLVVSFPAIGIALAVMSVPTLIRACLVVRECGKAGYTVTTIEKVRLYFAGLAIAYPIFLLTGAVAFVMSGVGNLLAQLLPYSLPAPRSFFEKYTGIAGGALTAVFLCRSWFKLPANRFGIWRIRRSNEVKEPR